MSIEPKPNNPTLQAFVAFVGNGTVAFPKNLSQLSAAVASFEQTGFASDRPHWTTIADAYLTGFMNANTNPNVRISTARKSKLILYLQEQGYEVLPEGMSPAFKRSRKWDTDDDTVLDFIRNWWKEKTGRDI